ncbi:asparagine synthase (glutamine-hydrolyzing) [Jannaschia sp. W003]|uniref:asparagine synthase (glutamine-hydrolyzing) n=1 Tax=Jannaschia sp. W003 TaxID=2867012 RepID=UPI0021A681FB|nr:asparagine synthase (glutamine-hydrolyzing) [Jannaschia sp. W003]UWQ21922.1 asparagine synthase (glutamine-hydrolyzing) [Jannaschia sp. W003]
MCGIVCLWRTGDASVARRMTERIAHRGPDDLQVTEAHGATLGHCRLAIIGPEDGRQPIHGTGAALVANGEIYNHAALRRELGEARFATHSDSETILHLAATGAPRWIDRLDGMFAFVLATPHGIVAGRDPLGIKPLYVARMGGGLAFASELKAFDGEAVEGVEAIAPGTLWSTDAASRQWWRIPAGQARPEPGFDTERAAAELRLLLEAAAAKWTVADVEVGAFLSGGLDSSIMAALAQGERQARGLPPLKTFAVGTEGAPDLVAARRVAAHIGSDHHEATFTPGDVADALPHVIRHLESADVDLVRSAVPTLFAARLARERVKAVLTGEGADELFAGYGYHHRMADDPEALALELTRSLGTMHNINLQRVDRMTMSVGLEARTPFLDRDLLLFSQTLPASLKMRRDPASGRTVEKWILRRACADLLPSDLVWRAKAQFDEGSGVVAAREAALGALIGGAVTRAAEGALYERTLRAAFEAPDRILAMAGRWEDGRVPND